MPKKPPPPEKRFKPGQSGNPGGRPKLPEDVREAKRLTQAALERTLNDFLFMDREALQARLKEPSAPMIEVIIGSIIAKAATGSDQMRLAFLLDRMIGKIKEPAQDLNFNFSLLPRDQLIEAGKQAIKILQQGKRKE
jgi:uncharacterized protein DUF5681